MHFWNLKVSIYLSITLLPSNISMRALCHPSITDCVKFMRMLMHLRWWAPGHSDDAWPGWRSASPRCCWASSWSASASTRWTAARPSGGCSTPWWSNTTSSRGRSTMSPTPLSSHSASRCSKLSMWWVLFFLIIPVTLWILLLGAVRSTSFNYWWKQ